MIEPQEGCDFVDMRWPHVLVFSSPRGPFLPAPHTQYERHEGQFDEPVTRVDGGELPWHVIPHHGAHKDHEMKTNPNHSQTPSCTAPLQSTTPSCTTKRANKYPVPCDPGRGLRRSLHEYPPSHAVRLPLASNCRARDARPGCGAT